jgi:hypothetical protein
MPHQQLTPTASTVPPLLDTSGMVVESVDLGDGRVIDLRALRARLTLEGQAVFAGKVYERVAQGEALFWAINAASEEMSPPGYWSEKALSPEEQRRWLRSPEPALARAAELAEEAGVEWPDDREALERASLEADSLPISEEEKRAVVLTMYRSGWDVDADDFDEDGQPHHAELVTNLSPQQAFDQISATPAPVLAPPPSPAPAPRARSNLGGGSGRPGRRAGGSRTSRGSPRLDDPDRPPLAARRRA